MIADEHGAARVTSSPSRQLVAMGYLSFVLIGWNAVLLPSLIRSLERDFHQSDAAFGLLFFLTAIVYATGSFGGGFLTERWGRRVVLTVGALLIGLGFVGEASAPAWVFLLGSAAVVNWGAGAIDGGVNGLFLDLFRDARGGALNLLHFFFSLGALVAPAVIGGMVTLGVSWRWVPLGAGVVAVLVAALVHRSDMPTGHHRAPVVEPHTVVTPSERSLWPFAGLAVAIGCYVAGEISVSNWLVKFLTGVPLSAATGVLSAFWAGLALGRLLTNRLAEHFDYVNFTVACVIVSSVCTMVAVLVPSVPLSAALFAFAGLFSGPIYPMIMAIGGDMYPHRLARLSGSLGAAAVVGSIVYPPAIGLMASTVGVGAGLFGAGLIGLPAALGLIGGRWARRRTAA